MVITNMSETHDTDSAYQSTFLTDHSIAYLAREITRIYTRNLQDAIAEHDILIGQYHFLRVLWEKDEITQRELANAVGMKESQHSPRSPVWKSKAYSLGRETQTIAEK